MCCNNIIFLLYKHEWFKYNLIIELHSTDKCTIDLNITDRMYEVMLRFCFIHNRNRTRAMSCVILIWHRALNDKDRECGARTTITYCHIALKLCAEWQGTGIWRHDNNDETIRKREHWTRRSWRYILTFSKTFSSI